MMSSEDKYREIQLVEELGEQIGYGNLMGIASALWARKLNDYDPITGISTGALVPTRYNFLTDTGKSITKTSVANEYGWVDLYFKEQK